MKSISYPIFIRSMEKCFDQVVEAKETFIMPWKTEQSVVMLSMEEYNQLKQRAYIKQEEIK